MLLDSDLTLGMRRQPRIIDSQHVRALLQRLRHHSAIAAGFAGAEVEGLCAAVGEPAVESGGDGADCVLEEGETGVDLGRVEGGDAHKDVRVAVDVFCYGVDDDVGAVVEWVLEVGGEEGVVDYDLDAVAVGDVRHGADVD